MRNTGVCDRGHGWFCRLEGMLSAEKEIIASENAKYSSGFPHEKYSAAPPYFHPQHESTLGPCFPASSNALVAGTTLGCGGYTSRELGNNMNGLAKVPRPIPLYFI